MPLRWMVSALLLGGCTSTSTSSGGSTGSPGGSTTAEPQPSTTIASSIGESSSSTDGPSTDGPSTGGSSTGEPSCPPLPDPFECGADCMEWGAEAGRLEVPTELGSLVWVDVAANEEAVALVVRGSNATRVSLLDADLIELWSVDLFESIDNGFPSVAFDAEGGVLVSGAVASSGPARVARLDADGAQSWNTTAPGRIIRLFSVPGEATWGVSPAPGMDSGELFSIEPEGLILGPLQAGPADVDPYQREFRWVTGVADTLLVVGADRVSEQSDFVGWIEGSTATDALHVELDATVAAVGNCETLYAAHETDSWPRLAHLTNDGDELWSHALTDSLDPQWMARDGDQVWVASNALRTLAVRRFDLTGGRSHAVLDIPYTGIPSAVRLALMPGGDLYAVQPPEPGEPVVLRRLSR